MRNERAVSWSDLGTPARAFRVAHGAWGALNLAGLTYIWASAAAHHRDRATDAALALLLIEGGALLIGRGDCPFGPFQARLGDPVPMFEWVLPPRAARAAVPVLAATSVAGICVLLVRSRRSDSSLRWP